MRRPALWRWLVTGLVVGTAAWGAGCTTKKHADPEPVCTAGGKTVECWWILHGCMPGVSPRDACMSICRDQEAGQLKICEGHLPQSRQSVMMSVKGLRCNRCLRFSDKPLGQR